MVRPERSEDEDKQQTLENTEGAIKNGQSRDTGNTGHKTHDEDKQHQIKVRDTEGAIKNGQSRDTGSMVTKDTRRRQTKSNKRNRKLKGQSIISQSKGTDNIGYTRRKQTNQTKKTTTQYVLDTTTNTLLFIISSYKLYFT